MQKSAKGLISFFYNLHMSPLLEKKIGSGKVRHWEKSPIQLRSVSSKVTEFRLILTAKLFFFKEKVKNWSKTYINGHP